MEQSSLFGEAAAHCGAVRFAPGFDGWLVAARDALAAGKRPADVWWQEDREAEYGPRLRLRELEKLLEPDGRCAACFRNDDRWSLLYQLLWRLHHGEPHVLELASDPDVTRLTRYAKAVRRDRHKMKAFVRFREVDDGGDEPRYVSWFEPDHLIVRLTAPFFQRRFTGMRWSILTPDGCAHWEGAGKVWFSPGVDRGSAPQADRYEDAWRVYFRSIFNPARLKVNAMRAEMPQKYWKNLPEAHEIGQLIRDADRRVERMQDEVKERDELRCGPRPAAPRQVLAQQQAAARPGSLDQLRLAAASCAACPLADCATQTVFGEGPQTARVMIVGEQPGDAEDLAGRPFVGPAGQLLARVLDQNGVARDALYLTNAVKHFGFEQRGRRRLHKTPTIQSVQACMDWLRQEMAVVDPKVIIALGRTAGTAVLGRPVQVMRERGRAVVHDGRVVWLTVHPSYVLRQRNPDTRRAAYATLVADVAAALADTAG